MIKQKTKAFTLVELIVVIIILAILGTIAFISLQGYSKDARDSARVSDLSSMKTSLEVFQLGAGKYPIPSDGIDITYSGTTVWTQGSFGETVFSNISSLDKIPIDPITNSNYTYSTTQNRGEYQLGGIIEGDQIAKSKLGIVNSTLAAGAVDATALVTGTYNGQVTKSLSGSTTCNIIAVPSIITNDTNTIDLETINTENRFVYTGKNNLPSSFKSSKFNNEGGFNFQLNKLVAYTDTSSCVDLTSKTSVTSRIEMLKGIQDAYSGTTLKDEGEIKNILALDINLSNPSTAVKNYAGLFVNNNLGGSIGTTGGGDSQQSQTYNISSSLLFNSINNSLLYITPTSAGNRQKWTWSGWIKRTTTGAKGIFSSQNTTKILDALNFNSDGTIGMQMYNYPELNYTWVTSNIFTDTNKWYHILLSVDTTIYGAGNWIKIYVDGQEQTLTNTRHSGTTNTTEQNFNGTINTTNIHRMGYYYTSNPIYADQYYSEVNFIDGQALLPSNFGETLNSTWIPKQYTGTYGTNGFHLKFDDNSTVNALGTDSSGNGNNWAPSGMTTLNQSTLSPTN